MTFINCSKKLVSSVFKSCVLLEQRFVFRSTCSVPGARCHSLRLPRHLPVNVSSQHRWHHIPTSPIDNKILYKQMCSVSSDSKMSTGLFQEDSHQRSPETFTLDVLVALLRQENAVDICVIKVQQQIKYAEYFIVVSGVSPRHLRAMGLYAIKVHKFMKKDGAPNVKIEGKDTDDWMCIDFGNMVVHFMLPEAREVYELEKLWTLRSYDEQLKSIPAEMIPEDFIYDIEVTK